MNTMTGGAVKISIDLPMQIGPEVAVQIEKESVFVSPKLDRIRVGADRKTAVLDVRDGAFTSEVVEKAHRFVAVMARKCAGSVAGNSTSNVRIDSGPYQSGVDAELVRRGWVHDFGGGQVACTGPVPRLSRMVDEMASALYVKYFNAVEALFLSVQDDTCPAPVYPMLAGKRLNEAGVALSWQGRVCRAGSPETCGLERLSGFTTREIVFAGTEGFAANRSKRALPLIVELAQVFDLDMEIVKGEILVPVLDGKGGTRALTCGSVDLHGRLFGEKFNITASDGKAARTGCVNLGIERWILAAFTQHGFDPMRWPEGVRDAVFG